VTVVVCPHCGASRGHRQPCTRCGHRYTGQRGSTRADRRRRAHVIARDAYTCQECGAPLTGGRDTQVDHAVSKRDGGSDDATNLRALCAPCNLRKGGDSTVLR
jgi:5-methylcytosine-specific restriction endonuclease McrA